MSLLAQHSLPSCLPPFNLPAAVFSHLCLSPHLLSISFPPSFPLSSFFPPIFPCPPSLSCPLHQFLNLCFLFFFTFLSIILPFSSLSHFFSPPFLFVTLILCLFSLPLHFLVISLTSHVLSPPLTFSISEVLACMPPSVKGALFQSPTFPEFSVGMETHTCGKVVLSLWESRDTVLHKGQEDCRSSLCCLGVLGPHF